MNTIRTFVRLSQREQEQRGSGDVRAAMEYDF